MKAINRAVYFVLFCIYFTTLSAQFAGGTGTSLNPYQVQTPAQLDLVRNYLTAYFIQIADIDLDVPPFNENEGWEPIGTAASNFRGSYNGNNFKISNLFIDRPFTDDVGLFGVANTGTQQNITISNADVTGSSNVGALAGQFVNRAVLTNCASSGKVIGEQNVGGLAGVLSSRINVTGSYSICDVEGYGGYTGGLFGLVEATSTVTNAFARGNVNSFSGPTGGLIGGIAGSTVTNTFSCGEVPNMGGFYGFGGLIGDILTTATINGSYWDVETSGQESSAGGTGKLTEEMKDQQTFTGWDFSTPVWVIEEEQNLGYPYLAWSVPELPEEPENPFAGGDGSELDPYQVATAEQLNTVRDYPEAFFIQIADIDLGVAPWNENEGWIPVGDGDVPFVGSYDGGNYKISNLTINRGSENFIGLFGFTNDVELKNLVLAGVNITGQDFTGSLAGYCFDIDPEFRTIIYNCTSTGIVNGSGNAGGLIGYAEECTITNSFYNGTVNAGSSTGGLVGQTYQYCTILNCYTGGTVTGTSGVGGFIGVADGEIKNCYSTSSVIATGYAGGFIGSVNSWSSIFNCYSTGYVDCSGSYTGGFIGEAGYEQQHTVNCYWDTVTSGQQYSDGGEGRTTAEMKTQSTFHNWDFVTPIWNINETVNEGYPTLERYETLPLETFAGGTGTQIDPYLIATPTQLDSVRSHLSSSFLLSNDIYLDVYPWNDGDGWVPLNEYPDMFTGCFNGNDNHIYGLTINYADYPGLFADCDGAVFSNIKIESVSISGGLLAGALATSLFDCTIEKCSSSGSVTSSSQAGGLAGYLSGTTVNECFSVCTVNSSDYAGGLFGVVRENSVITDCYSTGDVNGSYYSGGFVGYTETSSFTNCYSSGQVNGISDIGGFAGYTSGSTAVLCFWDTETSGQTVSAAGEGKTTAEMKLQPTYSGWDFANTWAINSGGNDGYPYLIWQALPTAFGAPQNVRTEISGNDLIITWDPVLNTTYYVVMYSYEPYGTYYPWDMIVSNTITVSMYENKHFFYIVAWNEEKEEILKKLNSRPAR
ncbi:MAG: GLUG motif-containing protein [Candidatus Delongbacteria bacterium]|jgi:hypothetical protein|nr:GLUG motif-containing protein [Candidatus Delongbacteria bacterium]